jgi:hypothetical protein
MRARKFVLDSQLLQKKFKISFVLPATVSLKIFDFGVLLHLDLLDEMSVLFSADGSGVFVGDCCCRAPACEHREM